MLGNASVAFSYQWWRVFVRAGAGLAWASQSLIEAGADGEGQSSVSWSGKGVGYTLAQKIVGQAMTTDTPASWEHPINLVGADMTRRAAQQVYEESGIGPQDVDVVELHDCFTVNEVITYEGLSLCEEGGATDFVTAGDNTYGGKYVVNPSGGLMSKGHPIGGTGVGECYELVNQVRGTAGQRQVPGARVAREITFGSFGSEATDVPTPAKTMTKKNNVIPVTRVNNLFCLIFPPPFFESSVP